MDAISIEVRGAAALEAKLSALNKALQGQKLLSALAREGMDQTRRRLEIKKTSPDGAAWARRRDGGGALFNTGAHIAANIQTAVSGNQASWGISKSAFPGAMAHQYGAVIVPVKGKSLKFSAGGKDVYVKKVVIPARPYLGISSANAIALEHTAVTYIAGELAK